MRSPNRRLAAVCDSYDVGHLPRRRVRGGSNNEHWYVGNGLVLRRYSSLRSETMIDFEHRVLSHLHDAGWPVAAPIPTRHGRPVVVDEGRHYTLFPRLPGRTGGRRRDPRALGQLLASLHLDLQPLAEQMTTPSPGTVFPPAFWTVFDPIWEALGDLPEPALAAAMRRAIDKLADDIARANVDSVPSGIIHGEWRSGQMLYRGRTIVGVLDFDFTHPDLLAVDLGIATSTADVPTSAEIVKGYRAERELSETEVTVIGLARRAVRLHYIWPSLHAVRNGDATGLAGIRLQLDKHDEAENSWPTLLAAIS